MTVLIRCLALLEKKRKIKIPRWKEQRISIKIRRGDVKTLEGFNEQR
jgi:hypothetical protein